MGGDIKVIRKDGPGTLMQLSLLLSTPIDGTSQQCQNEFADNRLMVRELYLFPNISILKESAEENIHEGLRY